jgi:type I restriction enzyme, S subunit
MAKIRMSDSHRSGWPTVKFGDVVRNLRETSQDPLADGFDRYVGVANLEPENLHLRTWGSIAEDGTSFTRVFRVGQVLFSKRRSYQGKAALADFDGICSGDLLVFEAIEEYLLPGLLPFIVQSDGFFAHALSTSAGSLSPRTKWKDLAAYEFALPPLDEQHRIAEILWSADEAVQRYREAIDKLARLSKKIQYDHFAGVLDAVASCTVKMVPLAEVCREPISNGIFKTRDEFGSGTKLVNVKNVYTDFRVHPVELERVNASSEEVERFSALSGDVIFNRSSLVFDGVGHACLIPETDEPLVYECHLMRVRPDTSQILPEYLTRYALSQFGRRYIESVARMTTMTTINQQDLSQMPIPLSDVGLQRDLCSRLDALDTQHESLGSHIEILCGLQKHVLNKYLSS